MFHRFSGKKICRHLLLLLLAFSTAPTAATAAVIIEVNERSVHDFVLFTFPIHTRNTRKTLFDYIAPAFSLVKMELCIHTATQCVYSSERAS